MDERIARREGEHADESADVMEEGEGDRGGERERKSAVAPGRSRKHGDVSRCSADEARRRSWDRSSASRVARSDVFPLVLEGTTAR